MFCVLSDEERREGQRVLQPSESQTEHDVPALSTVISYTGHMKVFSSLSLLYKHQKQS